MPEFGANMYGVHPTYTALEPRGGLSHAVLFLNSAAQEWSTAPAPSLTYRAIGGVMDAYFFMGPDPDAVNRQVSCTRKLFSLLRIFPQT